MYILPGGSLSKMAYTGRLRPKVVPFKSFFMLQVYKRVGINISLLVEVFSLDNDYFLVQCIICFVGLLMASSEARLYNLHHKTGFIRLLRSDLLTAKRGHRNNVLN